MSGAMSGGRSNASAELLAMIDGMLAAITESPTAHERRDTLLDMRCAVMQIMELDRAAREVSAMPFRRSARAR